MTQDANKKTAVKLALTALCMFGFGYALVPLYNVFCEVAGLNGKTGEISMAEASASVRDTSRSVTVEFITSVNSELPWRFKPLEKKVKINPGEIKEVIFVAENLTSSTVIGQAVPSVAPQKASIYFNKTECFCFTQQRLGPGEVKEMPVRFVVDPDLPDDINIMTLSYTFFKSPTSDVQASEGTAKHQSEERS